MSRALAASHSVKDDRCRISTGLLRNDRNVIALAPDLQLLDSCCAKRITRREHDRKALVFKTTRQFANGCGLARAIHTNHQNDERSMLLVDFQWHRDGLEN